MGDQQFQVETERRPERAVVVASIGQQVDERSALEEICELLTTANVETVGTIVQRRDDPDPGSYVGSGKVGELERMVRHLDPDIVVVDDELTPRQQRTLEDRLKRRVFDRTAVILDIFALHAHTAEGKLQVELAQLEYNLVRMRGMWKHLERLGGGVGTRGPGESQLETDRRLARQRIDVLRKRLREVSRHRRTIRQRRQQSTVPKIALAGYTNAGKSTLLNALTGATVSVRNRLFETLDPTTRAFEYDGRRYLVTDTVGFIERLPHQLVDAFASTLEETLQAELVVLVADVSLPEDKLAQQIAAVEDVLASIGAGDIPTVRCLNKVDLIDADERTRKRSRHPDAVFVSAAASDNLDGLMTRIAKEFASRWIDVRLVVPYEDAGVLSELYDAGAPVTRSDEADGIHATAHVPQRMLHRIERYRVETNAVVER